MSTGNAAAGTALVLGAGPGIGSSLARLLGREGYAVGLVARDRGRLDALAGELQAEGLTVVWTTADVADPDSLAAGLLRLTEQTGRVDLLHLNPSVFRQQDPLALTAQQLLADLAVGVAPLLTAVQTLRPSLGAGARITVTGSLAADRPWHEAASLGVQRAAVRNLVLSVDATLRPDGIRATSLTVRGTLAATGPFSHDAVAEALLAAARQDEQD